MSQEGKDTIIVRTSLVKAVSTLAHAYTNTQRPTSDERLNLASEQLVDARMALSQIRLEPFDDPEQDHMLLAGARALVISVQLELDKWGAS